jgi:hypothetical protein
MGLETLARSSIKFPRKISMRGIIRWMEHLRRSVPLVRVVLHDNKTHELMDNCRIRSAHIDGRIYSRQTILEYVCYTRDEPRRLFEGCSFNDPDGREKLTKDGWTLMNKVYRTSLKYFCRESL